MNRCVIVAGASINDYPAVKKELRADDFYIFCDCGLFHAEKLEISPDLIVGDFDSHEKPDLDVETIVLPCEKDDTDTFFAVKEAVKRGFKEFLLVGVIGNRFDHTMGNISILFMLDSLGLKAMAIDDYSEMSVISREPGLVKNCSYFSILNMDGSAKGITIKNAKYPLDKGEISCDYQYGISNEVLPGETAEISVESGRVLLVKVR